MDQAVDQIKEFLRQCIKYRFWISVGVAALFSVIAYFLGASPVQAKADKETATITSAANDVKQFAQPGIPNDQYKPIVDEKTEVLTRDVNTAWKQLYQRQAPLLTWPKDVEQRFREWGRKWPENVAPSAVELAKVDYILAYPAYVETVYQTFHPFNYETGTGIVAAPPKESLLRPNVFDQTKLPELGVIWAGQERLWIQRTVLDVVAKVNKKAKDWDSAIVKQINLLEVGNSVAQDQRSIAKGEELAESEKISAPGSETEEEAPAAGGGGGGGGGGGMESAMRNAMMAMGGRGGMGGMSGMGSVGASATSPESIFYVKPENDKGQYKILPIMLSVLVDQDHVQDLLVEMENSPMAIQVMDFELQRPSTRVVKPEKGTQANIIGYGGDMMMRGRMGSMGSMAGYGGMMSNYTAMMQNMQRRGGGGGMMGPEMAMRNSMAMGMGMGGMGATPQAARKGVDKRSTNRGEARKEERKAVETDKGRSLFDPYYDIVEVKVYGQARFYNPPPADAETEPSPGETAAKAAEAGGAASSEAPKTEPPAKAETAKAEPPKAEPAKAEAVKAEPAKAEPAKTEPARAEAVKTDPAKAEPAKAEPAKAEPKTSGPAPAAPKT